MALHLYGPGLAEFLRYPNGILTFLVHCTCDNKEGLTHQQVTSWLTEQRPVPAPRRWQQPRSNGDVTDAPHGIA